MTKQENLARAPIVEAIIAVQFEPLSPSNEKQLEYFVDLLSLQLKAEKEKLFTEEAMFEITPQGAKMTSKKTAMGFKLIFEDGNYVVQVSGASLALSRMKNYEDGDEFILRFQQIWEQYCKTLAQKRMLRFGLRYINQFQCAQSEYIECFNITPGMNLDDLMVSQIQSTHTVHCAEYDCSALIRTVENATPDGNTSLIVHTVFDIDAFKTTAIPVGTFQEIAPIFQSLRKLKNRIFFANLTDKGKAMFI